MSASAPITERRYVAPLILVTTLFFLWALGVNLNDILVPHLKKVFNLTDTLSSLVQVAFFGGYCLSAIPAGRLLERIGYQRGIVVGLLTCAVGALLFIPAASVRVYFLFLLALFVMACGQGVLEVAANPYVTLLGPSESSERRLNLAQSFNSVGAFLTPFIGAAFILSTVEYSREQLAVMNSAQLDAYRASLANSVKLPYLVIAGVFLVFATLFFFSQLPEISSESKSRSAFNELQHVLRYAHLRKGVVAQFCYVGAQVGVASYIIRFAQYMSPGLPQASAALYVKVHLMGFMVGRFSGSYVMRRIPPARLLSIFAACTLVCLALVLSANGVAGLWAIALIGFFHSIMFPTIFALSIKRLGPLTKLGSSLLVASIIGGAVFPALMGFISDHRSIRQAFFVPAVCQAYVLYFALTGYKPVEVSGATLSPKIISVAE